MTTEDERHDVACEREWESGAGAYTPCRCASRSAARVEAVADALRDWLTPPPVRVAMFRDDAGRLHGDGVLGVDGRALRALVHATARAELADVLREVYDAIHGRRLEHDEGKGAGPDSFYGGVVAARGEVVRIAAGYGLTEQDVNGAVAAEAQGGGGNG